MKDLLVLSGKRVQELRVGRKWSQEEFAHASGLHRTYIGQIERGEKNISFANLLKISGVLGVTMSELLAGLESDDGRTTSAHDDSSLRSGSIARQICCDCRCETRIIGNVGLFKASDKTRAGVVTTPAYHHQADG